MRLFCKCGSRTAHLGKLWIKILMTIIVIYAMVSALKFCTAIAQEDIEIETRKWWAINSHNELVELFVNNENGAWTIIITRPNDPISCALIGGDHSGANYSEDFK